MSYEPPITGLSPFPRLPRLSGPLAALADIPEEEIWLAKKKSASAPAVFTGSTCSISWENPPL
jgi:hypothetical protein